MEEIVGVAQKRGGAALMAVLNTTPDSFYDGGRYPDETTLAARIDELVDKGADIIDIGAESTRPGAQTIDAQEQWRRSQFAVCHAVATGRPVSIDTTLPEVAERALQAGARILNDVSCLQDQDLAQVAAHHDAHLVIMHSRGAASAMTGFSQYGDEQYEDVVADVCREWNLARTKAEAKGVPREKIWFDPGFGFHKNADQSRRMMQRLSEFQSLGARMLVGTSRKSFIGALDGSPPENRLGGTIASCILAVQAGASVLRVHDVFEVRQALLSMRIFAPEHGSDPERKHEGLRHAG